MKITICGSILHYPQMVKLKNLLEKENHSVNIPPTEIKNEQGTLISVEDYYLLRQNATENDKWVWDRKKELIKDYFRLIDESDIILVANYEKNGVEGYIGGNTLMEMAVAFNIDKPIYLYNNIPEISYKEEILEMQPIILNGDLNLIQ